MIAFFALEAGQSGGRTYRPTFGYSYPNWLRWSATVPTDLGTTDDLSADTPCHVKRVVAQPRTGSRCRLKRLTQLRVRDVALRDIRPQCP